MRSPIGTPSSNSTRPLYKSDTRIQKSDPMETLLSGAPHADAYRAAIRQYDATVPAHIAIAAAPAAIEAALRAAIGDTPTARAAGQWLLLCGGRSPAARLAQRTTLIARGGVDTTRATPEFALYVHALLVCRGDSDIADAASAPRETWIDASHMDALLSAAIQTTCTPDQRFDTPRATLHAWVVALFGEQQLRDSVSVPTAIPPATMSNTRILLCVLAARKGQLAQAAALAAAISDSPSAARDVLLLAQLLTGPQWIRAVIPALRAADRCRLVEADVQHCAMRGLTDRWVPRTLHLREYAFAESTLALTLTEMSVTYDPALLVALLTASRHSAHAPRVVAAVARTLAEARPARSMDVVALAPELTYVCLPDDPWLAAARVLHTACALADRAPHADDAIATWQAYSQPGITDDDRVFFLTALWAAAAAGQRIRAPTGVLPLPTSDAVAYMRQMLVARADNTAPPITDAQALYMSFAQLEANAPYIRRARHLLLAEIDRAYTQSAVVYQHETLSRDKAQRTVADAWTQYQRRGERALSALMDARRDAQLTLGTGAIVLLCAHAHCLRPSATSRGIVVPLTRPLHECMHAFVCSAHVAEAIEAHTTAVRGVHCVRLRDVFPWLLDVGMLPDAHLPTAVLAGFSAEPLHARRLLPTGTEFGDRVSLDMPAYSPVFVADAATARGHLLWRAFATQHADLLRAKRSEEHTDAVYRKWYTFVARHMPAGPRDPAYGAMANCARSFFSRVPLHPAHAAPWTQIPAAIGSGPRPLDSATAGTSAAKRAAPQARCPDAAFGEHWRQVQSDKSPFLDTPPCAFQVLYEHGKKQFATHVYVIDHTEVYARWDVYGNPAGPLYKRAPQPRSDSRVTRMQRMAEYLRQLNWRPDGPVDHETYVTLFTRLCMDTGAVERSLKRFFGVTEQPQGNGDDFWKFLLAYVYAFCAPVQNGIRWPPLNVFTASGDGRVYATELCVAMYALRWLPHNTQTPPIAVISHEHIDEVRKLLATVPSKTAIAGAKRPSTGPERADWQYLRGLLAGGTVVQQDRPGAVDQLAGSQSQEDDSAEPPQEWGPPGPNGGWPIYDLYGDGQLPDGYGDAFTLRLSPSPRP